MLSTFFLRKRLPNPTQGNTQFVHGIVFDPGAEAWATESTVADPAYLTRVFPQWNFTTLEISPGTDMVFQALSLPADPAAGNPFGGVLSEHLIPESIYPNVSGEFYS
jgi:hypothetical protein